MKDRDQQADERFEMLVDHAEKMRGRLGFDDVRELARLYRLATARLTWLRTRRFDPQAVAHLNALCVRAYAHLQIPPPQRLAFGRFFLTDLPRTRAASAQLQLVVAIILLSGAIIGATIVSENPAALYACIPASMYPADELERLMNSSEARARFLAYRSVGLGFKSVFSSILFTHNMRVGLLAFASGILAGVPTLILVFFTGLTLGSFAYIFSRDSGTFAFWAWILPHAIPELLALTLCAAGGLTIALAVIAPGRRSVAAALHEAARPALELVLAAIPLFLAAAGIESFLRQSMLSIAGRYLAALLALFAIVAYCRYVRGLERRQKRAGFSWLFKSMPAAVLPDIDSEPTQ